ncbi:unnamed protein product [Urochloa humidicola]
MFCTFDIDVVGNREADWCDENTRIVCEIFADEVQKGHRDTTHLNKTGYQNMIRRFKERTGLVYCRRQFKNRWDKLRKDYGIWKQIMKETGLGWDEIGKNIVMSETWWKETAKVCDMLLICSSIFLCLVTVIYCSSILLYVL